MNDDEIIAEVRRARARILENCGGTLDGLYAHLKALEKRDRARPVVERAPRRVRRRKASVA